MNRYSNRLSLPLAAWLFLDETLKKAPKEETVDNESMTTECDTESLISIETELTANVMITTDAMVTTNGRVTDDSESEATSVDDIEPLLESHDPVVKTNWKTKFWELFYDRVYCCHGCKLRKINCKLTRKDLISVRDKMVTMVKLMKDRRVIVSVSLYGLLGLAAIITNEVAPLNIALCSDHMISIGVSLTHGDSS